MSEKCTATRNLRYKKIFFPAPKVVKTKLLCQHDSFLSFKNSSNWFYRFLQRQSRIKFPGVFNLKCFTCTCICTIYMQFFIYQNDKTTTCFVFSLLIPIYPFSKISISFYRIFPPQSNSHLFSGGRAYSVWHVNLEIIDCYNVFAVFIFFLTWHV